MSENIPACAIDTDVRPVVQPAAIASHTGVDQLLLSNIPALLLGNALLDVGDLDRHDAVSPVRGRNTFGALGGEEVAG